MLENLIYFTLKEAELTKQQKQAFIAAVKKESGQLGEKAMTLLQAERQEGIEQGMQKGMEQEKAVIARNLLSKSIDDQIIIESTGLSKSQLSALKKSQDH